MTKLKPIGIFHTPVDWDELMRWINSHPADDRAHITTGAAMAWNLACKQSEEEK